MLNYRYSTGAKCPR